MKKILILGHTGFVGRELTKRFKKSKIKFDGFSKSEVLVDNKIFKKNYNILPKMINRNNIIINCVGESIDIKHMNSRNFYFVKSILNLIKKTKKKKYLIHLSSCAVYGKYFHFKNYIISKKTKPKPISIYAKTKLKGDELIVNNNNHNLNYTIIRPAQVVGFDMKAVGFINLAKFIRRRIFVYVSTGNAVRNYVNSEDLTLLISKLCFSNKIKNNIYIISRYSRLKSIITIIAKNNGINNYLNIVLPKFFLIFSLSIIKIFYKKFPVNKEIIEGLSITAKIKSNFFQDFKNFKLQNINQYLNKISK